MGELCTSKIVFFLSNKKYAIYLTCRLSDIKQNIVLAKYVRFRTFCVRYRKYYTKTMNFIHKHIAVYLVNSVQIFTYSHKVYIL